MQAQVETPDPSVMELARDSASASAVGRFCGRLWLSIGRVPRGLPFAVALAYYGFIWWLSSLPGSTGKRSFLWTYLFNGGHAVLFGLMGLLLCWCVPRTIGRASGRRAGLMVVAVVGVLGLIDEVHQASSPGRDASFGDLGTDLSGATFLIFLLRFLQFGHPLDRRLCVAGLLGGIVFPFIESVDAF